MRIGGRTIKTAIAVIISSFIMKYVFNETPFFACIGAVVAVGSTMQTSLEEAFLRNLGTVIGGVLGMFITQFTDSIIITGLGVIPLILIITNLKKQQSLVAGCIVYFGVVHLNKMGIGMGYVYAFRSIMGNLLGSFVGLAMNYIIKPPSKDKAKAEG